MIAAVRGIQNLQLKKSLPLPVDPRFRFQGQFIGFSQKGGISAILSPTSPYRAPGLAPLKRRRAFGAAATFAAGAFLSAGTSPQPPLGVQRRKPSACSGARPVTFG
jgi:hypothetical protein